MRLVYAITLGSTPASRMRRATSDATEGLPATAAASITLPNTWRF